MTDLTQTERIPVWNPVTREWRTAEVPASPMPRARTARRRTRPAQPSLGWEGLSAGSPLESMTDTAYAPGEPLADMRTYVKAPAMRTHRAAVVMPAGLATGARYAQLDQ